MERNDTMDRTTLILTRRDMESIEVGEDVTITVKICGGGRVKLVVQAPRDVKVLRSELNRT